ncbi:hypothetical protein BDZ89DRAFT_1133294 [Hymenopellis radicata]|nr:hypothetical protein BDZ89DRAFT_1133294 [Hymenopellis radicata]
MPKSKATHEPLRLRIPPIKPPTTSKPSKPPRQHQIRFGNVSATEAAEGRMKKADRQNHQLLARQQACTLYVRKLILSTEQSIAIQHLYDANKIESYEFHVGGEAEQESQQATATVMGIHGLTFAALDEVDNRWSVAWSENTGEGDSAMKRLTKFSGSDCGYDHTVAGSKKRNTPAPYTACLAHAEITYVVSTQKIYRVRGFFQHNDACKDALLTRIPREYLHPSVYRLALDQLANGVPLRQVRKNNRDLVRSRSYPDMSLDPRQWRYRYLIGKADTASLYRQLSRLQGVNVDQRPHVNIHEWLDTSSPQYDPVFAEAVFHYNERAERGDRIEVCVATNEMKDAAWKYGHGKQLIMDGTFGICNRKVLLFVLMGVDEENKGVPLAFLFFSAPSGNKHTAAGYDSEVLARLLEKWKQSLEERIALLRVFPDIILLICRVHLRRSWRNHRNKCLPGKESKVTDTWRRLQALEDALVLSTSFEAAKALVENEYDVIRHDLPNDDPTRAGALEHLDYLWGYWMSSGKSDDLWKSWSDFGRTIAAQLLQCPLNNILPTTNHLESFNRVLKHTYLPQAQHGGHRLRFDVLLKFIIRDMMPSIFEERSARLEELNRRKARALCLVNGEQPPRCPNWAIRFDVAGLSSASVGALSSAPSETSVISESSIRTPCAARQRPPTSSAHIPILPIVIPPPAHRQFHYCTQ